MIKINKNIKLLIFPLRVLTVLLFTFTVSLSAENDTDKCPSLYEIAAIQLNIRDKPNTSGKIVGKLNKYDNVCVAAFSGDWAQIENGWISSKYITAVVNSKVTENQMISANMNDTDNTMVNGFSNSMETESQQNVVHNENTKKSISGAGVVGIVIGISIVAFIGFALYNLFIHSLIALKLAEPDGRKKMGIRSTLLGRFVQGLLVFLLFLLFMIIGAASK